MSHRSDNFRGFDGSKSFKNKLDGILGKHEVAANGVFKYKKNLNK